LKKLLKISRDVQLSSAMIDGFWTEFAPTYWLLRVNQKHTGLKEISANTRKTNGKDSARTQAVRTESFTVH